MGEVVEEFAQVEVKEGEYRPWSHVRHDHAQVDQAFVALNVFALLQPLGDNLVNKLVTPFRCMESRVESHLQWEELES